MVIHYSKHKNLIQILLFLVRCKLLSWDFPSGQWLRLHVPNVGVLSSIPGSVQFSSVQFGCSVVSKSLRAHGLKHTRLPHPLPTPGVYSNSRPLMSDAIQPSHPLSSPSPPTFNLSQHQGLFRWVSSSHQVAKVLEFQLQHQSLVRGLRSYMQQLRHGTSK